jgi:hypothetical protein
VLRGLRVKAGVLVERYVVGGVLVAVDVAAAAAVMAAVEEGEFALAGGVVAVWRCGVRLLREVMLASLFQRG